MSNFFNLASEDFGLIDGKKGKLLSIMNCKGVMLVLFFSNECNKCMGENGALSILRRLSTEFPDCKFGACNLGKNQKIISASNLSISPINYVPYIILYLDGRPYMRYDGKRDYVTMRKFMTEALGTLIISSSKVSSERMEDNIGGVPYNVICDEERCYLTFEGAYEGKQCDDEVCYLTFTDAYGAS